MKKILFYTDTPMLGGAERQMFLLAKFLPKEKYNVTLACSAYKNLDGWCEKFIKEGCNVIRLKVAHKHDPRHYFALKKILPNFDLLHLHLWNPASCRYAFMAAQHIPIVVTEHDPFLLGSFKKSLKNALSKKVKKIIVASAAAEKEVLKNTPHVAERIIIIPNGIDIEEFKKEIKNNGRDEYRTKYFHATSNEKIILCVAELHPRKGQRFLIEAVKLLLPNFPNLKLALVGEGPARNEYESQTRDIKDRILLLGWRNDVEKLMNAADIFVLPSLREAFGLVLLEAALAGLPTIATHVGGIPEIIEHEKTGLLIEPQNANELANAIRTILSNPDKSKEWSAEAAKKVETQFGAKAMAEKTGEAYDELL